MALGRWQATIVDEAGNVLPGAQVTVRRETAGAPLAVLFADRDGLVPLGNPFPAAGDGFAAFHAAGGAFRIDAVSGSSTRTWRYVPVGLAAEADGLSTGIRYLFQSSIADADPGAGFFRFNHATLASVTQLFIDNVASNDIDMSAWLQTFDDGGSAGDRGVLVIEQDDGAGFFAATVTGTVVNGTGYRKVSVTPIATGGAFTAGKICSVSIYRRGTDGTVSGPVSSVVGRIATFADTAGDVLQDSGKTIDTVGAGKQTIWIPATAMVKRPASAGPTAGLFEVGAAAVSYLAYDPTNLEDAFFSIAMPKSWNEGQISAQVYWFHSTTATNFGVVWNIFGASYTNDEPINGVDFGSGTFVIDTGGTTNDLYISSETPLFSIGGAPQEGDFVNFIARREATNPSDTLAIDAFLIGVKIFYTTNANTDA